MTIRVTARRLGFEHTEVCEKKVLNFKGLDAASWIFLMWQRNCRSNA
jgi:hypothetical protein